MKKLIFLLLLCTSCTATFLPFPYVYTESCGTVQHSKVITRNTLVTTDSMSFVIKGKQYPMIGAEACYYRTYPRWYDGNTEVVVIYRNKYTLIK